MIKTKEVINKIETYELGNYKIDTLYRDNIFIKYDIFGPDDDIDSHVENHQMVFIHSGNIDLLELMVEVYNKIRKI